MSGYEAGRRVEYATIRHLQDNGYDTVRAASSKGLADVVAVKPGEALFVSCKRTRPPGPAERAELIRVAACIREGVPLVALKPIGQRLQFRRLTGPAASSWVPWVADEGMTE